MTMLGLFHRTHLTSSFFSRSLEYQSCSSTGTATCQHPRPRRAKTCAQVQGYPSLASRDASSGTPTPLAPLAGRYNFNQLKNMPEEQLRFELDIRGLPADGGRMQLASKLYMALIEENMVWPNTAPVSEGSSSVWEEGNRASSAGVIAGVADEEVAPLMRLQQSPSGLFMRSAEESVMANPIGAQVMFLWGHTAPNGIRVATSTAFRTKRSVWLFDCGEDTQRHLLRNPAISWVRVDRIFISSMTPDALLGLPGMLCTLSAARAKGHENADMPLHVYGPPGLVDFINNMLTVSRTYLEMPVIIHEFATGAVPEEQQVPVVVSRRARLYALRLPPDQLNQDGYYDGEIRTMLARHRRKKVGGGIDERAGTLPLPLPEAGDPSRSDVTLSSMVWTIRVDHEFIVKAAPLRHRQPAFGYFIREADRAGRLDPEAAVALGVRPGEDFSRLKEGIAVLGRHGDLVQPEQVVGPPRRGRRWAVVGSCHDSSDFARSVGDICDLLVHSMEPPQQALTDAEAASARRLAVAKSAGACAAHLAAQELVLWQPSASFLLSPSGEDADLPGQLTRAAQEHFHSPCVSFAGTFTAHQIERQDTAVDGVQSASASPTTDGALYR